LRKTLSISLCLILSLLVIGASLARVHASDSSKFIKSGFVEADHWLDFMTPCFSGITDPISYPANTRFFVSSGWGFVGWSTASSVEKTAFMSKTTTFTFAIDGVSQSQEKYVQYFSDSVGFIPADTMVKLLNTEYKNGLTGSHLFHGQLNIDGFLVGDTRGNSVLAVDCNVVINFTA